MSSHHEPTAWVRTSCSHGRRTVYHTDPDCQSLSEKKRPATEEEVAELDECPQPSCGNTAEQPSNQDMSAYNALKEAAK